MCIDGRGRCSNRCTLSQHKVLPKAMHLLLHWQCLELPSTWLSDATVGAAQGPAMHTAVAMATVTVSNIPVTVGNSWRHSAKSQSGSLFL